MTNTRFVLIDNTRKSVVVYDKKVVLAIYELTDTPLTAEDIEAARTEDYRSKA